MRANRGVKPGAAPSAHADAYAYARPRRSRGTLALTIGLHLLAAWWLQQRPVHPPRPVPDDRPRVVAILLPPVDAAATPMPGSPPERQPPRTTRSATDAVDLPPGVRQRDLPPVPVPPFDPPPAAPSSTASSSAMPPSSTTTATTVPGTPAGDHASIPDATTAPDAAAATTDTATTDTAPASAAGGFSASLGRHQAGRIDRELRGGKSGVPTSADTPWARFQRGVEDAHVETSLSAHLDSYTSPDGVVIYRRRVGGRTTCYQTGSVGLGVAGTRTSGNAGNVACPSGVTWKREE